MKTIKLESVATTVASTAAATVAATVAQTYSPVTFIILRFPRKALR